MFKANTTVELVLSEFPDSFLTTISLASIMITDLRFYVDKMRDRTPTGDY